MTAAQQTQIRNLCIHKLEQQKEDNLLLQQQNLYKGTYYGYMWYIGIYRGWWLADYKIYNTSNDINIISKSIEKEILLAKRKKETPNFLLYKVENINPQLVSYSIIKSSNYPYVTIHVCGKNEIYIFYAYGNNELYNIVYNNMKIIKDYDIYTQHLVSLKKNKLQEKYNEVFSKKPMKIYSKKKLIKKLCRTYFINLCNVELI